MHDIWQLEELFKIFCDHDEDSVRLVFVKAAIVTSNKDLSFENE